MHDLAVRCLQSSSGRISGETEVESFTDLLQDTATRFAVINMSKQCTLKRAADDSKTDDAVGTNVCEKIMSLIRLHTYARKTLISSMVVKQARLPVQ